MIIKLMSFHKTWLAANKVYMMKIGVIRFPGTNCDRDVAKAVELAGYRLTCPGVGL